MLASKEKRKRGQRGASRFRLAELCRALKGATTAGHDVNGVTICPETGSITIHLATPPRTAKPDQQSASS